MHSICFNRISTNKIGGKLVMHLVGDYKSSINGLIAIKRRTCSISVIVMFGVESVGPLIQITKNIVGLQRPKSNSRNRNKKHLRTSDAKK